MGDRERSRLERRVLDAARALGRHDTRVTGAPSPPTADWLAEFLDNAVLCYIDGRCAYFTTQNLDKQWGDDWNDAPYEHNAGTPYKWHATKKGTPKWEIIQVYFDNADYGTPGENAQFNSLYSVKSINAGEIPWLTPAQWFQTRDAAEPIFAGTTLRVFVNTIDGLGGAIFLPLRKEES